nr:helix-turn-helix transcriptional regulator [uncultured Dorea sp.]
MDSSDFYVTLGKKLRARRRTKHMTLSDLSKKLNKSVATISKYEKGEVLISIDTLVDICQILNIDIASLLPITSTDKSAAEIARYQNYFSDKLYLYWFNGEKNCLQKAVLENQNLSLTATMYYDVDDTSNYYEANYIYEGDISYSDTCTVFILVNTKPPFDILTLRLPFIGINFKHVVGLISTITYFYQSIAMKVIASENPLPLNDELINALHISSDELKNIKRTNFFFAQ